MSTHQHPGGTALPDPDAPATALLREALRTHGFTPDGCLDLLGATAYAALSRNETVPAMRATRTGGPLEALVRLFLLQCPVPRAAAAAALPLAECLAAGWLEAAGDTDEVRATVDIRPYGEAEQDWWIVADLGRAVGGAGGAAGSGRAAGADLVLGAGGASTTLSAITVRRPVSRALDLGTGCGVQALHAAPHAERVVATDLNPRALRVARLTTALSGVSNVDLRHGSLFEPVAGERFDLIVSNPPFVISPRGRFTYRDGGLPGDELVRTLVSHAGDHLAPGGYCQLLANWQHVRGEDWRERVRGWLPDGCDAWVVQREVQDPAQYAELWLRDAGDHEGDRGPDSAYARHYDAWLDTFARDGVEAVGFGWITLRASGAERPVVRLEEWPHPVEQPLGPEIEDWFARQDWLRDHDDKALLETRFRITEGVLQEQVGLPGAEDPEHVVLRQQRGMRRATRVDTVGAGFAGACDGTLRAGEIVDAIAALLGEDPTALRERTPESIRLLVDQGFLTPEH
ncbi:class I SAM-dependent methyltransferase [Allostreptomyces psammosilenae]|uniref:Methylase of polypeptide subunit release factors n=1 Tax=Allostreptomyces psammosilenae TaxID=1892865 RepID=A0A852ZY22_9ACTN|nr:class I SAM-dependent methyltransferase [Allostreptomyces psammosilenae]NYI05624.1 methylase of polypeptide subunit release factors [Allostreptomyces psammosilenae]